MYIISNKKGNTMSIQFPSYTEWLLEQGKESLERQWQSSPAESSMSLTAFCESAYELAHEDWAGRMGGNDEIIYEIDESADICDESAKLVLVQMINSCTEDGAVGEIVVDEDLAPDHETARAIVNQFWGFLIPDFQKWLKEWHS